MELMQAHNQWANREADERFDSLDSLESNAIDDAKHSREVAMAIGNLNIEPLGDDGLVLRGQKGYAEFTNFAFSQLMRKISYPEGAIVKDGENLIPNRLAADVINHRIQKQEVGTMVKLLLNTKGDVPLVRSITSDVYARVPDAALIPYLKTLEANGWKVPPARPAFQNQPGTRKATEEDCLYLNSRSGLAVKPGDLVAPAGLYRGDRDMFCFFTNLEDTTEDDNGGTKLTRILFVSNSEVGYRSFKVTEAICQEVCGNHIVWGAKDIVQVRYKHIGEAWNKIKECLESLIEHLAPRDMTRELQVMEWMRDNNLGSNMEEVTNTVYEMSLKSIAKKNINEAIYICEQNRATDGDPYSWMGVANGLTRLSQRERNADSRMDMDSATAVLFAKASKLVAV